MTVLTQEQIEHRGELIAALRSGEYRQATNTLRHGRGSSASYCCLGVACVLRDKHLSQRYYDLATSALHGKDADHYGFTTFHCQVMANLNDARRWSFDMIADWLEEVTRREALGNRLTHEQLENVAEDLRMANSCR